MALQKQPIALNFSGGVETKSDPFQTPIGKFSVLQNMVFNKGGMLLKRNGYAALPSLPDDSSLYVTTFKEGLTAIGGSISSYSQSSQAWANKGKLQPVKLDTLSLIRSNTNQIQADSVVASNGLVCTVFTDVTPTGTLYKYVVADSATGQNVVQPTLIPATGGVVTGSPRVFLLGRFFVIVFSNNYAGTYHLQYMAITTFDPTVVTAPVNITAQYTPNSRVAWDGYVANNSLAIAWNGNDGGGAIRLRRLDSGLMLHPTRVYAGFSATMVSVTADTTGNAPQYYVSFYNSGSTNGFTLSVDQNLSPIFAPVAITSGAPVLNIISCAQNSVCSLFFEIDNAYAYDSSIKTNFIRTRTVSNVGVVGALTTIIRSVGLASKAFISNGSIYMLSIYYSAFQPTYFLINSLGEVISKLAYSNGPTYYALGLPNVSVTGSVAQIPYLFKDLLESVNKTQGAVTAAGIYSQTGINLATYMLGTSNLSTSEIGNNLHLSGGFLWMYDGYVAVEHGFHVWPDNVEVTTSTTGGSLSAQQYFYQAVYEWTDNQGNIHRSAPSIPVSITTTGATSSNTVHIPTLRLTYKTANPVKIAIYRWSTAQQSYYQVTSIASPLLNDPTSNNAFFIDTLPDSAIIGNSLIYTTGGVVENIAAPATGISTLFKSRLWVVDSEDKNLLWFTKQVIETVPAEFSDLFTKYIAPTTSAQGATGDTTALSAMDDKLIIFKRDAIYYLTGTGPDNTGSNDDFSEPVFITSTVGCANPLSIVFSPKGLMFQSDKGIWLLGRDLSTSYVGADVEEFNDSLVQSAVNVPATNQVRFTLADGMTLMYDYYYAQWATFAGVPAISSTLFQSLHTYINSFGQVFQESLNKFLDGSKPVLIKFTTSWINTAGLQGFMRAYQLYLLGVYYSPHKLNVSIAYDYNSSPTQTSVIQPKNYTAPWGGEQLWGSGSAWGGPGNIEQWRVFLSQQKCESLQITVSETYDASIGAAAGAGFTLSGMNLVVGLKSGWPRVSAGQQVG